MYMYRLRLAYAELNRPIPCAERELRQYDSRASNAFYLFSEVAQYTHLPVGNIDAIRQLGELLYLVFLARGFSNADHILLYLNRVNC